MPDDIQLLTVNVPGAISVGLLPQSIEVPANSEIGDVLLTAGTAPTGASLIVDVLLNGTSVFAGNLGTIAAQGATAQGGGTGVGIADTQILVQAPVKTAPAIKVGQTLVIESEQVLVTAVSGGVQTGGTPPTQLCTVTRAQNGTTAATHAVGVAVTPAKPFIPAGATKSSSTEDASPAAGATAPVNAGDVLTFNVLQVGSTVAGSNLDIEVQLLNR